MKLLDGTRAWAEAIAALPSGAPLPMRCVLVPRERVAHALRRELVRTAKSELLVGTRFVRAAVVASEVLERAGVEYLAGEEDLRPARVHAIVRSGIRLKHFPLELLRERPGWDGALARTISDLESAGLRAADLPDDGAARDVRTIWRALDETAGACWTEARILAEAGSRVKLCPELWRNGASLAALTGHENAVLLAFVREIPDVHLALFAPDPRRDSVARRITALLAVELPPPVRRTACKTRRDVLAEYLFASPDVLAEPQRPRIAKQDGTVHLEEHAGVEEEVESAASWVAQRISDGIALEDIAVLAPAADPWISLISSRLARTDWLGGAMPVYAAGGVPLIETAAGARLLALIRALQAWLPIESIVAVLPSLRARERHLSRSEAIEVATMLGTVGGSAARPAGSLEWAARADAHVAEDPAHPAAEVAQSLRALCAVANVVLRGGTLAEIVQTVSGFAADHLLQPGMPAMPVLAKALEPLVTAVDLSGQDAVAVIHDTLTALRVPQGRFGEPAVYVGTVQGAVGVSFRCARIIGLAEGTIPAAAREDPVLPKAERRRFAAPGLQTPEQRVVAQLHALRRVIQDTSEEVALSASRVGSDGTQREFSSIFLEVLAALGAPQVDVRTMRRDEFRPARSAADADALAAPSSEALRLWRVARTRGAVPRHWLDREATDPRRIRLLRPADEWVAQDGILGPLPGRLLPGTTPERAISASRLQTLLKCPHLFLYDHLGWREPGGLPSLGSLEPMTYGSLFHDTAEAFYRAHGDAFSQRKRNLAHWKVAAKEVVDSSFGEFAKSWPLAGDAIRDQQKERLLRDLENLLEYDWAGGPRTFVDVEREFGETTPIALRLDADHVVHLKGRIDRLDVEGDHLLIRDLKTGRPKPRRGDEAGPTLGIDLQLALYGLVAQKLASEWNVPNKVDGAYVYADASGEHERAFREADFRELQKVAKVWMGAAVQLLEVGSFPRTPALDDCRYCGFKPVCRPEGPARSLQLLQGTDGALGAFLAIRVEPEEDE